MPAYAYKTRIASDNTRVEIEKLCVKHGAKSFVSGWEDDGVAAIMFEMADRRIRFRIKLPSADDKRIRKTDKYNKRRKVELIQREVEQLRRTMWRALLLVIKAKLESVAQGIESTEEAFLSQIVVATADGARTVSEWAKPIIAEAYERGEHMPPMLPGMTAKQLGAGK